MKTRKGKIGRLPRHTREALNRRLDDGESGPSLVRWLNTLPAVQGVLDEEFGGRPVTEQNLSEWRQGGFQDWLKQQEVVEWTRTMVDTAEALEETSDTASLAGHLATLAALEMGRLLRDGTPDGDPAERRKTVLAVAGAAANLRRVEIESEHARIKDERWEKELEDEHLERKKHMEEELRRMPQKIFLQAFGENAFISAMVGNQPPEQAEKLRAMYEDLRKKYRPGYRDDYPSNGVNPPSSDPS